MHGYLDGELDLIRNLEIEQHLRECSACATGLAGQRALRAAVKDADLYQPAPAGLKERIRSSLRREGLPRPSARALHWRWLAAAASLAFVALATLGIVAVLSRPSADEVRAQQVVAAHVRSLMADHLVDVRSSDRHEVKPWFSKKIALSPPVQDFKDKDFLLIGGRLDYPLDNAKAAVLVYQRRKHFINVFIWRLASGVDQAPRAMTRDGYHLIHWARDGLAFWMISDLNEAELDELARLIQRESRPND
jgi:anti-sigma factor RsiW